jgi:hypothetical protein
VSRLKPAAGRADKVSRSLDKVMLEGVSYSQSMG